MAAIGFDSENRNPRRSQPTNVVNPFAAAPPPQAPAAPPVTAPPSSQPARSGGQDRDSAFREFSQAYAQAGRTQLGADELGDFEALWRNAEGYDRPREWSEVFGEYKPRIAQRISGPAGPSQSGPQGPPGFQNTSPQFSDPAANLLENYALDRFNQRMNPNAQSGTAMYEQYLRELEQTLGQPVYSASDEALIKGRAIDDLTKERDATIARWMEEVSRRNLAPSSGPALEGLRRIEDHYNTLKTQVESGFARDAIDQTRQQRFQRADVLGNLAGSEEGRMADAGNYARIPLSLQDRSFSQGLQLVGAGGNPSNLFSNALSFLNVGQQNQQYAQQQQQQFVAGLMNYLGYLFG